MMARSTAASDVVTIIDNVTGSNPANNDIIAESKCTSPRFTIGGGWKPLARVMLHHDETSWVNCIQSAHVSRNLRDSRVTYMVTQV